MVAGSAMSRIALQIKAKVSALSLSRRTGTLSFGTNQSPNTAVVAFSAVGHAGFHIDAGAATQRPSGARTLALDALEGGIA